MPEIQNWGVTPPTICLAWTDYTCSKTARNTYFLDLLSFSTPDRFTNYHLEILPEMACCAFSRFPHCCNILPVDVSSELVKGFSICFEVIEISGSLAWALAFGIKLFVWHAKCDIPFQKFNIWRGDNWILCDIYNKSENSDNVRLKKRKPVFLCYNKL